MAGMPEPSSDVIHLEADVRRRPPTIPNGFAKDEFVPYLKIQVRARRRRRAARSLQVGRPDADGRLRRPALRGQHHQAHPGSTGSSTRSNRPRPAGSGVTSMPRRASPRGGSRSRSTFDWAIERRRAPAARPRRDRRAYIRRSSGPTPPGTRSGAAPRSAPAAPTATPRRSPSGSEACPGHPYEQGFDLRVVREKWAEPFAWGRPADGLRQLDERPLPPGRRRRRRSWRSPA